jgi:hypothetical protein
MKSCFATVKVATIEKIALGLVVTPLISFSVEKADAFSITGASTNTAKVEYKVGNTKYSSRLDPSSIQSITRGGTPDFLSTLKATFPTWTFNTAAKDLTGSFNINSYYACGPKTVCGKERGITNQTGGVGSFIDVSYVPGAGDPTPAASNLHWIQRVVDNHNIGPGGGHGVPENIIDVDPGQPNPYYDDGGFAGEDFLVDVPYRNDPDKNHNWLAELFLVEETAANTVTIYNGIQWGWKNGKQIDLTLLFDTTGSMSPYITGAQSAAQEMLDQLDSSGADYRVSVANYKDFPTSPYGSPGDYTYQSNLSFTDDNAAIKSAIDSMSSKISGGANIPESAYSAMIEAMNGQTYRDEVEKALVVLTDAPGHNPEPFTGYTQADVAAVSAAIDPVLIYPIIAGSNPDAAPSFQEIADKTKGKIFNASTGSDVAKALLEITGEVIDRPPTEVPEPTSILGTLAFGIFGGGFLQKRRSKRHK